MRLHLAVAAIVASRSSVASALTLQAVALPALALPVLAFPAMPIMDSIPAFDTITSRALFKHGNPGIGDMTKLKKFCNAYFMETDMTPFVDACAVKTENEAKDDCQVIAALHGAPPCCRRSIFKLLELPSIAICKQKRDDHDDNDDDDDFHLDKPHELAPDMPLLTRSETLPIERAITNMTALCSNWIDIDKKPYINKCKADFDSTEFCALDALVRNAPNPCKASVLRLINLPVNTPQKNIRVNWLGRPVYDCSSDVHEAIE